MKNTHIHYKDKIQDKDMTKKISWLHHKQQQQQAGFELVDVADKMHGQGPNMSVYTNNLL